MARRAVSAPGGSWSSSNSLKSIALLSPSEHLREALYRESGNKATSSWTPPRQWRRVASRRPAAAIVDKRLRAASLK
jgi:hypothetical protein